MLIGADELLGNVFKEQVDLGLLNPLPSSGAICDPVITVTRVGSTMSGRGIGRTFQLRASQCPACQIDNVGNSYLSL